MQFLLKARFLAMIFCVAGAFLFGFILPRPAQADPHGIFFTVVAQQQLFFNMLAALNQADYVEPAQLRNELLGDRIDAGFGRETDERTNATQTELASILSRPVTLEGADLWTAYIVHQEAIERARRRGAGEVAKVFCERGLGHCDDEEGDAKKVAAARERAYVYNPLSDGATPKLVGGLMALLSGRKNDDQKIRESILAEKEGEAKFPASYDAHVSAWWKGLGEQNQEIGEALVVNTLATSMLGDIVLPEVWSYWDVTKDKPTVQTPPGLTSETNGDEGAADLLAHFRATDYALYNQNALQATYARGVGRAVQQLEQTRVDGSKPDLVNNRLDGLNGEIGEIYTLVDTPAFAKNEQGRHGFAGILDAEQNLKFAAPRTGYDPNGESAFGSGGTGCTGQNCGVAGAQDDRSQIQGVTTSSESGQVAGVFDGFLNFFHELFAPRDPVQPLTDVHHEEPFADVLQAGSSDKTGGCGSLCGNGAFNDFGRDMINRINAF